VPAAGPEIPHSVCGAVCVGEMGPRACVRPHAAAPTQRLGCFGARAGKRQRPEPYWKVTVNERVLFDVLVSQWTGTTVALTV
jgi:hypothetical protein